MPTFFNNCCRRHHDSLYGKGAFFDLSTTGLQGKMAIDLKQGEECIVASYDDDGNVVFDWHKLSKEALEPDPDDPQSLVRVFYGERIKTERMPKAKAVKTKPYSVFFNSQENFKRPSVVK